MLSNKDLLQQPSARAPRFEAIWVKTQGTDFDKTLAMLQAYCDLKNWGTHSKGVWSVVEKYVGSMLSDGYCKTVEDKNVLLFKIEFLLLQLSEKIAFNKIKVEGDLAAIFHVIFTHTNINAYDFAQGTELYSGCEKYKEEIKRYAVKADSWKNLFQLSTFCDAPPSFFGALLKAKCIDYVDSWTLIRMDRNNVYSQHCAIVDEDFLQLFNSEKIQDRQDFIGYLYCKRYNLNIDNFRNNFRNNFRISNFSLGLLDTVNGLCGLTEEKIDGVLLLVLIKKVIQGEYTFGLSSRKDFFSTLVGLIEKRHYFENWNDIEEAMIGNNKINFTDFLLFAIERKLVNVIRYLLEEKKADIDLKSLSKMKEDYRESCYDSWQTNKTPVQTVFNIAQYSVFIRPGDDLEKFLEIIKILIRHDPDCVYVKDEEERDVFHYWRYASHLLKRDSEGAKPKEEMVANFLNQSHSVICGVFHRKKAFTFFQGKNEKDESNNINMLPNDVLGVICAHTIYSEIAAPKK
jgi:hypothetical protein